MKVANTKSEAMNFFLSHSEGSVLCRKEDGSEKECSTFTEAATFFITSNDKPAEPNQEQWRFEPAGKERNIETIPLDQWNERIAPITTVHFKDTEFKKVGEIKASKAIEAFENGVSLYTREGPNQYTKLESAPDVLTYLYRLYVREGLYVPSDIVRNLLEPESKFIAELIHKYIEDEKIDGSVVCSWPFVDIRFSNDYVFRMYYQFDNALQMLQAHVLLICQHAQQAAFLCDAQGKDGEAFSQWNPKFIESLGRRPNANKIIFEVVKYMLKSFSSPESTINIYKEPSLWNSRHYPGDAFKKAIEGMQESGDIQTAMRNRYPGISVSDHIPITHYGLNKDITGRPDGQGLVTPKNKLFAILADDIKELRQKSITHDYGDLDPAWLEQIGLADDEGLFNYILFDGKPLNECELIYKDESDNYRLYAIVDRDDHEFKACAVKFDNCIGVDHDDVWKEPSCVVELLFDVYAQPDGIRNLNVKRGFAGGFSGHIYDPDITVMSDMFLALSHLEKIVCVAKFTPTQDRNERKG